MTRKYEIPTENGSVEIPAELLDKIADDVRAFDRAESPKGRMAWALKTIARELPRIREAIKGHGETLEERLYQRFRLTATAVQVAQAAGVDQAEIRRYHRVQEVLNWLGVDQ